MDVYCTRHVLNTFHKQYSYIFDEKPYPGIPLLRFHLIENKAFEVQGIPIIPIEVMHYKLPVLGFRIGDFTYITDANYIAEEEWQKATGSKHLVLNALRRETHISHFTLDEAVEQAKKIGADQTWFTHMSHQIGLHEAVNAELPENMQLAFDGQVLEMPY
jgi:phosphoribosyl 1,2-cyclic phosphate phosphodiesterase